MRRHDRAADQPDLATAKFGSGPGPPVAENAGERHAPHNPHAWRVHDSPAFSFLSDLTAWKQPQLSLLFLRHIAIARAYLA